MPLHSWLSATILFFQWMPAKKIKSQDVPSEEKKDGCPKPGEEPPVNTPSEACNLAPEKHKETSPGGDPLLQKSGSEMRHRKEPANKPDGKLGEANAVSSPRRLEAATAEKAGLKEDVKFEKQVALGLLTFSAGAVINAKGTTIGRQLAGTQALAGGSQVYLQGFFFWGSIGLWFTSMLFSMLIVLLTTCQKKSKGLVMWSKIVNYFNITVSVLGVAFWIVS